MNYLLSRHEIIFQPDGKRARFNHGTNLLDAARKLGVDINSVCGGAGSCGKCIIKIVQGTIHINDLTCEEINLIGTEKVDTGYRLACRITVMGDCVVFVPRESRTNTQRLQTEGIKTVVDLEPYIWEKKIDNKTHIYYEKILLETIADEKPVYGFAVDIGTTKLAGYLMDLCTGDRVSVSTMMNPQIPYGDDIISRLSYALDSNEKQLTLHKVLVEGIRQLLRDACTKAEVEPDNVYDNVFVGNTAMQHFFLNLDPRPLSFNPFTPENISHRDIYSSQYQIGNQAGRIHIPPLIAGFIGADCIASILATGIHMSKENCFLMDIGTNTEIVVGNNDRLVACSCASGPAFEGAHIKCGMRAASGAIEGVWIDEKTLEPKIKTIDAKNPIGICGSGLIDLLSEMFKSGIIDSSGMFTNEHKTLRIRKNLKTKEYVITWKEASGIKEDIVVNQLDIRELQKAKAAIFSGANLAMNHLGVSTNDIKKVYIAGAFGTYINRESAVNVGMLPEFNLLDIEQVGNAAGTGARMMLLSRKARDESKKIRKKVEYIELATLTNYNKAYLDALLLPHMDLVKFPRTTNRLKNTKWVLGRLHKKNKIQL